MNILALESSCDETAAAVVFDGRKVLSSVVASQTDVHAIFGGVVPEIASREHLRVIDGLVAECLKRAGLTLEQIDAVAVSQGPGLIGALLVSVSYAKGLALSRSLPLIPVDHVRAHVHGALLAAEGELWDWFPLLALVVSGGHTNLYYMQSPTSFELFASTMDDACGECFDKVAKLLGLPYPGGPHIERLARGGDPSGYTMPQMVEENDRLAFSYSGLKTHMANLIRRLAAEETLAAATPSLCASFQDAALNQLIRKLRAGLRRHPDARSVVVAGGVAANQRFRALASEHLGVPTLFPPLTYCADNAAMIGAYAYFVQAQESDKSGYYNLEWDAYSRYHYEI